nr:Lpg1974 family pore-forming outer membrane protein [Legionella sp. km772]
MHLDSKDSSAGQGNQILDESHLAFVGPPFEMSPPVFGVRRVDAELKNNFDNVSINLEKIFSTSEEWLSAKISGGINFLYVKQTIATTFSDLVGSYPTPYSYPLPPDPSFNFNIQSISQFIGAGPDLGVGIQLSLFKGLSLVGAASSSLNVGTVSVQENFKATSKRLQQTGIGLSRQQIITPNKTQIVPGFDGRLGLAYEIKSKQISSFSIEGGYRLMSYLNAISTTAPQTRVQPGINPETPEFSTGTIAIVSTTQQDRPFNSCYAHKLVV